METIQLSRNKAPMKIYAIQRKSDGMYSRGGWQKWGKFPKTWAIGSLKSHLNMFYISDNRFYNPYSEYSNLSDDPSIYIPNTLFPKTFKYKDCEILEIDPMGLLVTNRFDAVDWTWHNAALPYYKKSRYWNKIKEFGAEIGLTI